MNYSIYHILICKCALTLMLNIIFTDTSVNFSKYFHLNYSPKLLWALAQTVLVKAQNAFISAHELWAQAQELWAQARELWAQARELWAQARELWAQAPELWAKAHAPFAQAQTVNFLNFKP